MAAKIRVYFEGNPGLKRGFGTLLTSLREKAARAGIGWELVAGGSRNEVLKDFSTALTKHRGDTLVMLVDAEGPVQPVHRDRPWEHLASLHDAALKRPKGSKGEHAHLMVQIMESWFVADRAALQTYFGQGFQAGCLPQTSNLEDAPKDTVLSGLSRAVAGTKNGRYAKSSDASELLARIDPTKVRAASKWCDRLFQTIEHAIEAHTQ